MIYGVVYLIWNLITGKRYVGQTTKNVEKRFKEHARCKKTGVGKAIRKYGKQNFRYGIIKSCSSKEELDKWEIYFIAVLKSKSPNGYNFTDGGESGSPCAEVRAKLSAGKMGEKNPNYGKNLPEETCAKMSIVRKGVPKSHEHRVKIGTKNRKESKYKILQEEITKRGLTYAIVAQAINLASNTFSHKMTGSCKFFPEQKAAIKNFLKTDLSIEELFKCENDQS